MIALCVLLFAAAAFAAGVSQPTPALSVLTRDGRQAEIRFINKITNPGPNVNINGQAGNAFTSQAADVKVLLGTNPTALTTFSVAQDTTQTSYTEIDTGNSGSATVTVTFATSTPVTITCPNAQKNDRTTYIVQQSSFTAPTSITNSGTCSAGGASCTQVTGTNAGSISFQCTILYTDSLTTGRSCSDVPVRFFNSFTGCPLLFETAESGSGATATKTFLINRPVPTTFAQVEQFDRKVQLQINDVDLFTPTTTARFIDATISSGGALTTTSYSTAFINVANLAYRETTGARDNTFTIVVSQSSSISALSKVVHFQTNVNVGSFSGWIEVPTGSAYSVHVFDDSVINKVAVFGDNSIAVPTAPTASALASGTTPTLNVNDVRVVRITNDATTATLVVNSVPLNTASVAFDATRHVIWNNIVSKSAKLAAPDAQCCNFVTDAGETDDVFTHNLVGDANTLSPAATSGSFSVNVYSSSATCTNLGSPIVPATVQLTDSTGSSQCADEGVFVFGRAVTFTTPTCTATPNGMGGCNAASLSNPSTEVIASMTGVPTDQSPAGTIFIATTVPFCDCTPPPTACTPSLSCEEQAQVDLITAAITSSASSVTSTITSAVSSSTTSIQTTVQAVNNTFITNIDDNNAGIDIALAAIASTNNTLHVQLGKVQTTQAEHTTTLSSLQRKVLREINGVEDDIEDVADDIDDIAKAVDA